MGSLMGSLKRVFAGRAVQVLRPSFVVAWLENQRQRHGQPLVEHAHEWHGDGHIELPGCSGISEAAPRHWRQAGGCFDGRTAVLVVGLTLIPGPQLIQMVQAGGGRAAQTTADWPITGGRAGGRAADGRTVSHSQSDYGSDQDRPELTAAAAVAADVATLADRLIAQADALLPPPPAAAAAAAGSEGAASSQAGVVYLVFGKIGGPLREQLAAGGPPPPPPPHDIDPHNIDPHNIDPHIGTPRPLSWARRSSVARCCVVGW